MKKFSRKKLLISAVIALILLIFCYWQNNMLTISEYTYSSPKIAEELDGFRIVQISDLHNKNFGNRLIDKITELNPDIIVITGDIVDSNHTNIETALKFARKSAETAPSYYVTGNHEYWLEISERAELTDGLESAGVKILNDETVTVEKDGASFSLTGLDDNTLMSDFRNILPSNKNTLNILLAHEPQYIASYSSSGSVDLVFTGHAHGGQFILPFIGGVVAPDQGFFPKYTDGIHKSADTSMVISRGLGNSVIPVRLFNFPDIVCLDLKHS
ncbi:MAG: metallophosphoesterase [Ruminococcus flavefaciens]|nr:metallophosphoesterase [Ruminococcus flavefaciens]MCM1230452.1 metallophosphoesterase [Ruminococcus flavefaciens]